MPLVQLYPSPSSAASAPAKVVVRVCGDLDAETVPELRDTLTELIDRQGVVSLVVDLQGLTFIDSSGIYALVQALKHAQLRGADLTLTGVSAGAHKVLDICGLTGVFDANDARHVL